jgi:leader peptidase (prepilin peptidase) / N-methyltransferase
VEATIFGIFGLIIGSFLNVLILREGTEEGLGGRSACVQCRHTLSAHDLIPVISWVLLSGRCRYCRAPISLQYPLVELLTGALFFLVSVTPLSTIQQILALVVISTCIAIAVYDLYYMLIPDRWNYVFIVAAFFFGWTSLSHTALAIHIVSGPFVALPLFSLWAFSRGAWMGFGDVKFSLGIGWLLGPYFGYVAVMGGFIIGACVSVAILLPLASFLSYAQERGIKWLSGTSTRFTMRSEVPFGPFLIVSTLTVWFCILFGVVIPLVG